MNRHIAITARVAALGIAAALALAACTGTASTTSEDVAVGSMGAVAGAPGAPVPEGGGAVTDRSVSADAGGATAQSTITDRQVVRTAYVAIAADDVAKTAFTVHGLVAKSNGVISNEQTQATGESTSSMITAQIPADRLDVFIADVSGLGTVDSVSVTADDVTAQAVDLDARIKALQTSVDRMTQLLAQAKQIDDLLAIETQLSARQAELDALTAQRRYLATQVAMSSVTVAISPIATLAPVDAPGFLTGLQNGWTAFVSLVTVAVTALGFLLPFLLIGLVILVPIAYFGVRHARRTRRLARAYAEDSGTPLDDRAHTSAPT